MPQTGGPPREPALVRGRMLSGLSNFSLALRVLQAPLLLLGPTQRFEDFGDGDVNVHEAEPADGASQVRILPPEVPLRREIRK